MENSQTQLTKTVSEDVVKKLNGAVVAVISAEKIEGFEKAYLIADAVGQLKSVLTADYMKPIMNLQGNRLGFKTDRDKDGGYSVDVVKNCLIEAVLTGVQPFGNQFNIIAGNCYITKEGMGHLLKNLPELKGNYEVIPELPRIKEDKSGAAVVMNIEWTINGEKKTRKIDFPIKLNSMMGTDAVIGKATRKARAWLFYTLTGMEIGDGDVTDIDHKVMNGNGKEEGPIPTKEELQALSEIAEPNLTKQEFEDCKRILGNNEENNYRKLHEMLIKKTTVNQ